MSSKSSFFSAGELHQLLPLLNCSLPLQPNRPLYIRNCSKVSSGHKKFSCFSDEFGFGNASLAQKWAPGRGAFSSDSSGIRPQLYRKGHRLLHLPVAASSERTDNASSKDSSNGDDRNPSSHLLSDNYAGQSISKELNALDAYFSKLQGSNQAETSNGEPLPAVSSGEPLLAAGSSSIQTLVDNNTPEEIANVDLDSDSKKSTQAEEDELTAYFEKLDKVISVSKSEEQTREMLQQIEYPAALHLFDAVEVDSEDPTDADGSEPSMVYVLAAINIAVYLFGLASPIDTAGMGISTLPLLYGAKVNALILDGQWWRLITPMFLHSGFLHVALSSWALLFFGPQVEKVFGSLAFCMIYFLGGLCGNLVSFLYTPAATVGGTGPFFALLSSWLVYLLRNKKELGEQAADFGIRMTFLLGVLVICLSCLLPIDEWIHFGATIPGAVFGGYACPSVRVVANANDTPAKHAESSEGLYGMYEGPTPLSMTLVFSISIAVLLGIFNLFAPVIAESELFP